MRQARGGRGSGDDVGVQLVFKKDQAIAQQQFALFQPLNLQLIHPADGKQRVYGGFEIMMLEPKALHF